MAKSHLDRHLELDLDIDATTLDKRLSTLNDDQCWIYDKSVAIILLHEQDHKNGACKCAKHKCL